METPIVGVHAQTYRRGDIGYEISVDTLRDRFCAVWGCPACGTAGTMSANCPNLATAIQAARTSIDEHHQSVHVGHSKAAR